MTDTSNGKEMRSRMISFRTFFEYDLAGDVCVCVCARDARHHRRAATGERKNETCRVARNVPAKQIYIYAGTYARRELRANKQCVAIYALCDIVSVTRPIKSVCDYATLVRPLANTRTHTQAHPSSRSQVTLECFANEVSHQRTIYSSYRSGNLAACVCLV